MTILKSKMYAYVIQSLVDVHNHSIMSAIFVCFVNIDFTWAKTSHKTTSQPMHMHSHSPSPRFPKSHPHKCIYKIIIELVLVLHVKAPYIESK